MTLADELFTPRTRRSTLPCPHAYIEQHTVIRDIPSIVIRCKDCKEPLRVRLINPPKEDEVIVEFVEVVKIVERPIVEKGTLWLALAIVAFVAYGLTLWWLMAS